ncbi:hypothetical protein FOZ60_005517 [Perkinsus olseni]|uniref:Uncharacterized protein n=1 Tax=Perkinsus olseni TaxID=32597 RepID=A0A7J6PGU3_PEROL|nr:hypothetical protein FOZ60_005517 [Perkinsus olseni]
MLMNDEDRSETGMHKLGSLRRLQGLETAVGRLERFELAVKRLDRLELTVERLEAAVQWVEPQKRTPEGSSRMRGIEGNSSRLWAIREDADSQEAGA